LEKNLRQERFIISPALLKFKNSGAFRRPFADVWLTIIMKFTPSFVFIAMEFTMVQAVLPLAVSTLQASCA
jgi:hypothetical protein